MFIREKDEICRFGCGRLLSYNETLPFLLSQLVRIVNFQMIFFSCLISLCPQIFSQVVALSLFFSSIGAPLVGIFALLPSIGS